MRQNSPFSVRARCQDRRVCLKTTAMFAARNQQRSEFHQERSSHQAHGSRNYISASPGDPEIGALPNITLVFDWFRSNSSLQLAAILTYARSCLYFIVNFVFFGCVVWRQILISLQKEPVWICIWPVLEKVTVRLKKVRVRCKKYSLELFNIWLWNFALNG